MKGRETRESSYFAMKTQKHNLKYRYTLAKFQNSSIAQKGPTYPETKKDKFIALGISNFNFDLTLV